MKDISLSPFLARFTLHLQLVRRCYLLIAHWLWKSTIICACMPYFYFLRKAGCRPNLAQNHQCTQTLMCVSYGRNEFVFRGWNYFFQWSLVDVCGELLYYLALGILLFIFLWLVRLFRTQLLASDASLELIVPFLCSQLHSSPSSSGSSCSSLSSTSLSSSLRSSRSTYEWNVQVTITSVPPPLSFASLTILTLPRKTNL